MRLPFGLSSYSRADGRLAPVRLLNLLVEKSPTVAGQIALLARPAKAPLYSRAGVRGIYREDGVYGGDVFVVAGTTLYRDNVSVGTVTGSGSIDFAYTVDGLFVRGGGIVYQYDGTTLTATTFPDSASVVSMCALNSILLGVRGDTGRIYFRLPGDTVWNSLDFFSAEREPDPVICIKALADTLWAYGSSSIEPFVPTGDAAVPFQRLSGASISRGVKSADSVSQLDNTLFHIGENNIAYRLTDGSPQRISENGQEERFALSSTAVTWNFVWDGHEVWVVALDDETLAYDVSSGNWCEFTNFPSVGFYDGSTIFAGGAAVWTLEDRPDDDGDELERLFTYVIPAEVPLSVDCVEVSLSPGVSGVGDEPAVVQHRFSDDQARTWSDWVEASTGFGGDYRKRVRYRRQGMVDAPGRLGEVRITDPTPIRFSGVEMNPPGGGRSR